VITKRTELAGLEQMRAVNHPARWRVLEELWKGRVLTATAAAELVGLTPSAMSYHLQHLARLGLIERDDSTDGRERPWRAIGDGVSMTTQPDDDLGATMMRNLLASVGRLLTTAPPGPDESRRWPASFTHTRLRLTPDQAKTLHERVQSVIADLEQQPGDDTVGGEPDPRADLEVFWIQGTPAE
jgi:predicted ArsR family transcriptional regulator